MMDNLVNSKRDPPSSPTGNLESSPGKSTGTMGVVRNNTEAAAPTPSMEFQIQSIAPVFSTCNLARWLNHYRALGFQVSSFGTEYGFASRDGFQLHVSVNPEHDPLRTAGCAYLYVKDAEAVYTAWSSASESLMDGEGEGCYTRNVAPVDTPYGLLEGAHHDPDNNLLRYGSRIEEEKDQVMTT